MTKPILSICIPTYNRASLLKSQLTTLALSIINIPNHHYEILIRDNASSDETYDIIEGFRVKYPIRYSKNNKNIGALKNILSATIGAEGEYLWLLGDDDLVIPDSIKTILETIKENPELNGFIISHAIEPSANRDEIEQALSNRNERYFSNCLIRPDVKSQRLQRFEEILKYTDISAALNFLSNVIVKRSEWEEKVDKYLQHAESREEFSDVITCAGHVCIWSEILSGKAVYMITRPLVIGFVGQQEFIEKWQTMMMVHFLNLSEYFLKDGADKDCIKLYQRNIFKHSQVIYQLSVSSVPYTTKYFSLHELISKYGNDPFLWTSLSNSTNFAKGWKSYLKYLSRLFTAITRTPNRWGKGYSWLSKTLLKKLFSKFKKTTVEPGYIDLIKGFNDKAIEFFNKEIECQGKAVVHHPVFIKNGKHIRIGKDFHSGPGLRLEAWDKHRNNAYSPSIEIGNNVSFGYQCHVGAINSIVIKDSVLIGSNVLIIDHQHGRFDKSILNLPIKDQPLYSRGPVVIGDNTWIGENACIMPGVTIGKNCIIGANSVVTKSIPNNSMAMGIPAKVYKSIGEND